MSGKVSQTGNKPDVRYSEPQMQAITHVRGSMMVIAGPGSGKTTVITERIKYLIESAGVSPADILVITFTRAAAGEMENRFRALTDGKGYPVRFGTFHSIFFWIIKTAYNLNNSSVISEDEKRSILDRIMNHMSVRYDNKDDIISSVLAQISLVKCDMIDIDNYYSRDMSDEVFRTLYSELDRELKRLGKIDFDDMMVMCYELLTKRRDILEQCRHIFRFILVDEFQDSNKLQYEILKLLAKPDENVFVVGDDDQSVYGFRGARPEIMQQFIKDFRGCKQVVLGENYRCDRRITELSAKLIQNNKNRFTKLLSAKNQNDGVVRIIRTKDNNDENNKLIEELRKNHASGIPYEQQAVLYRTNIQPRRLVYKLDSYNIPYTLSDSMPNIFEHFAVRNMLDYMHVATGDMSRTRFLRIMNRPGRYISRDMLLEDPVDYDALRWRLRQKSYAVDNLDKMIADLKLIRKMRPYPALNFIRKFVGYDAYLKEYAEYRQTDEGEFYDILDEFASMIVDMTSFGELFEYVEDYTEVLNRQELKKRDRSGVNLMTMHSAKGLEFDSVYILDAVEGITPYKKARTPSELEEERRMFYVAMTRARHSLVIYTPDVVAGKVMDQSRYVSDIMG
ncbi:MAG: ATP-dependent helicase [Wujia sp.]